MQGGCYSHGGNHLTLALKEKIWNLMSPKPKFIAHSDMPLIEALKEKHCYAALDYNNAVKSLETFSFPVKTDYHRVQLNGERFQIPEMFFTKEHFGQSIDVYLEKFLLIYEVPIILCGGSSLFPGKYFKNNSLQAT